MNFTEIVAIGATASLLFTVPIVSFIKNEKWPTAVKFLVAVLLSVVVASIQVATAHNVQNWTDFFALGGVDLAASQAIYHLYFNGSWLDATLTKAVWGKQNTNG